VGAHLTAKSQSAPRAGERTKEVGLRKEIDLAQGSGVSVNMAASRLAEAPGGRHSP
jgi:hypothetical protein